MSKLPIVSGAECIKALGKIGFEVYRQRGSHFVLVRKSPPAQTTIPNHKELDRGTLRAIISKPALPLKNLWRCFEIFRIQWIYRNGKMCFNGL